MDATELIIFCFLVLIAKTTETISGFGGTIIAVTLGALFFPIEQIIPILVPSHIILSTYIVLRHYKFIRWRILLTRIFPFFLIGLPGGIVVFYYGSGGILKICFGVFTVAITLWELFNLFYKKSAPKRLPMYQSAIVLILGGFIHGLYASGGPMAVYYTSREIENKSEFRSTLNILWLGLNTILVINYAITSKINVETLKSSAYLIIPLVLSIFIGEWVHAKINERIFRICIYVLLLLSGAALLF